MKKIAAFTIAELLVVSLLSLICALAAFSTIHSFNYNFKEYQNDTSTSLEIHNLYTQLNRDFYEAKEIIVEEQNLSFVFPQNTINYTISPIHIIRSSDILIHQPDTLFRNDLSFETFYKKTKVSSGRIDQLALQINIEGYSDFFNFSFHKSYSAKSLINGAQNK